MRGARKGEKKHAPKCSPHSFNHFRPLRKHCVIPRSDAARIGASISTRCPAIILSSLPPYRLGQSPLCRRTSSSLGIAVHKGRSKKPHCRNEACEDTGFASNMQLALAPDVQTNAEGGRFMPMRIPISAARAPWRCCGSPATRTKPPSGSASALPSVPTSDSPVLPGLYWYQSSPAMAGKYSELWLSWLAWGTDVDPKTVPGWCSPLFFCLRSLQPCSQGLVQRGNTTGPSRSSSILFKVE